MKERMKSGFPDIGSVNVSCDGACVTIRYDNGTEVFVDALTSGFHFKVKAGYAEAQARTEGVGGCDVSVTYRDKE